MIKIHLINFNLKIVKKLKIKRCPCLNKIIKKLILATLRNKDLKCSQNILMIIVIYRTKKFLNRMRMIIKMKKKINIVIKIYRLKEQKLLIIKYH